MFILVTEKKAIRLVADLVQQKLYIMLGSVGNQTTVLRSNTAKSLIWL
jgi:hypothetical protein